MIISVDVVGVFLHYSRHRQPVGPNVPLLSCPIRSFFRGPRSTASTVNTSIIPRSNLFLWVFEAFRLIIPVDTEQTNYHFKHRKQAKSAAVTSKATCVILGAIQDHKDVSVCSSVLLVTSFYPHCVCCWHGCRKKLPHLIIFLRKTQKTLDIWHRSDTSFFVRSNVALTFLFQTKSSFRVIFVIIISLLHERLIHRNKLSGKLSVILIDSQPPFARKEVPKIYMPGYITFPCQKICLKYFPLHTTQWCSSTHAEALSAM